MKLLLLQPPIQDFYDTEIRLQPVGLAYLKAAVKQHLPQIEVIIKDYHHGWGRQTVTVPRELQYLKEYNAHADSSPFSTFHYFYHFGAGYQAIADEVYKQKPDLIGISSLFTAYYQQVLDTAKAIKVKWNVPIVAGGSHVSAVPNHLLQYAEIDYVIRGEGERPLVEFLYAWLNRKDFRTVPNLGFKVDGQPVLNEMEENYSLDALPVPDLSDFELHRYQYRKKPLTCVFTSRGCPYNCSFCSVHLTFGRHYRRRRVSDVLSEIEQRYQQGYRVFDFEDDSLTFNRQEIKDICRKLIERFAHGEITCTAMNGIFYHDLDRELLHLMHRVGFHDLNISLVSVDTGILTENRRSRGLEEYIEIVQIAHELGFRIVSYQILGLPAETLDSMIQAIIFTSRLPVLLGMSPFYLTPGMPVAQKFPPLTSSAMICSRLTALGYQGTGHNRDDLYTLFLAARILNFLKRLEFDEPQMSLNLLMARMRNTSIRTGSAITVLNKLLDERILYADTAQGLKPYKRFNFNLFFDLWSKLEYITTRSGRRIII
jgi:hypothetical protein